MIFEAKPAIICLWRASMPTKLEPSSFLNKGMDLMKSKNILGWKEKEDTSYMLILHLTLILIQVMVTTTVEDGLLD
jgi:hypothetical protein